MLQQSRYFELMGRDGTLNANKIIGQPFLKVVEESSQIHVIS